MLRRVCEAPRLYVEDTFARPLECAELAAALADWPLEPTDHGAWADLPPLPALAPVEARVLRLLGAPTDARVVRRLRRYRAGQGHPPHLDDYEDAGQTLVITALLTLRGPPQGGLTRFPHAAPRPVHVRALPGRLTVWYGYTPEGALDPCAAHDASPVEEGEKLTLTFFVYAALRGLNLEGPDDIRRFAFVDDGVPDTTRSALAEAALARGLDWRPVEAGTYDYAPHRRLRAGDVLYCAAVSARAERVERHLWAPGVGTVHLGPQGPYAALRDQRGVLERAGVPVPDAVPIATTQRRLLRAWVERVGGLPAVLKFPGGEGGVGVTRVDSLPALFSLVDLARSQGAVPDLMAYYPDAQCWRVVVVGARAVAAYPNPTAADDFRSHAPADPAEYERPAPPGVEALAVRATTALGLGLGGVDVLVCAGGLARVLEVNCPCYFGHAQAHGRDVAGALLDALLSQP